MTKSPRWLQTGCSNGRNSVPRTHASTCDSPPMTPAKARRSTRGWRSLAFVFASLLACRRGESTLAQRSAGDQPSAKNPADDDPKATAKADAKPDPKAEAKPDAKAEPSASQGPGELVDLWIDLDPKKRFRILTVGMLTLPLVNRPAGFAREETITPRDCTGEKAARTCTIEHTFDKFEAEPPTGRILEQGEKRFDGVTSSHGIDARGLKLGDATIVGPAGPPDFADTELGKSLVPLHRLACVRLPSEPVGIGAKWSDSCALVFGGQLARMDVAWELTALSDDPISGKRAELSMVGKLIITDDDDGERTGVVEGKLYFFVDAHAPHILRLLGKVPLGAGQKLETETSLNLQFGHVDDKGVVTRTDGQPMPPPPPRAAPGAPAGAPAESTEPTTPVVKATPPR